MLSKDNFLKIAKNVERTFEWSDKLTDFFDGSENPIAMYLENILDAIADDVGDKDDKVVGRMIYDFLFTFKPNGYDKGDFLVKVKGKQYKPTTWEEYYDMMVELAEMTK